MVWSVLSSLQKERCWVPWINKFASMFLNPQYVNKPWYKKFLNPLPFHPNQKRGTYVNVCVKRLYFRWETSFLIANHNLLLQYVHLSVKFINILEHIIIRILCYYLKIYEPGVVWYQKETDCTNENHNKHNSFPKKRTKLFNTTISKLPLTYVKLFNQVVDIESSS